MGTVRWKLLLPVYQGSQRHLIRLNGLLLTDVWTYTCIFAVAWLAGYVAPGAPAGVGVREAGLVFLLTPLFNSGFSVAISLTLRLTTTIGDFVAFLFGLVGQKMLASHN